MVSAVRNHSDRQRIVLIVDVVNTPTVRDLLPRKLREGVDERMAPAPGLVRMLNQWRAARAA